MKTAILSLIAISFSASAFAASEKICFGTGEMKGTRFEVKLSTKSATITRATNDINGTFKADGTVEGRDGKTYVSYDLGIMDGANNLLVETALLKSGTKGWAKIRNRGEGFFQENYFCKDLE